MKKLICMFISLILIMGSSLAVAYANNNGKAKGLEKEIKKIESGSDIAALRLQLKENHKNKAIRKELIRQIVRIRRQNNNNSTAIFVDGSEVTSDVLPVIKEGRTLVPVRAITNALGADVAWSQETKTVTVTKSVYGAETTTIQIKLDSQIVTVNGTEVKIDVPAQLISNRTMVPIRFISETFKKAVDWDGDSNSVIIDDEDDETAATSSTEEEPATTTTTTTTVTTTTTSTESATQ